MAVNLLTSTINESWPMLIIFITVLTGVRILKLINSNEKFVLYEEIINMLFLIYCVILFQLLTKTSGVRKGFNYIPFKEITRYKIGTELFYYNVIGNILVFVPFGFFVSKHIKSIKASQIILLTAVISSVVEYVQFYIGRAFDVDDILLNVVGAFCGFLIYIALKAIVNHLPKFLRKNAFYNIITILFTIFMVIYILRFLGFRCF